MLSHDCKIRVWYKHTDQMAICHHSNYICYYEAARSELLRDLGMSFAEVERRGIMMPILEVQSKYRKPAYFDELLTVRIILREKPAARINFFYEIYNEKGELIAPVESSNFMSLPILSIEPGCEDAIPYLSRLMRDIRSGILPVEAGAIATVDVSPSRGVELYLEDREMRLSLAPDDWDGNLLRLGATIGDLARRRELSSVQEVRASQNSVWVVLRRPVEQQ